MKTSFCFFLSFGAVWFLLLQPMGASTDKVGYIFTGRFYLEGPDPLGLHGAHFVLTATVDADARASSFVDEGDNQGTAVYPSGSSVTIWGADNPALNRTYLPWAGAPDSLEASWHSHSLFDKVNFKATFLLDDGISPQPVSVPRFYVGLNYDCIYSLPCVPLIEWVYWDPYDLFGESFSTSDVFGQSFFLRAHGAKEGIALVLQYVVDAVAQVVPELGTSTLGPLWIDPDHRPVFETLDPPFFAVVVQGPVDLSITNPYGEVFNKNIRAVPGAVYLETTLGIAGSPADFVLIFDPVPGRYEIQVVPEEEATPEDAFSLIGIDRGQQARVKLLADSLKIGAAETFFYSDLVGMLDVVVSVKPGSCPKTLNLKSEGKLSVAILGGDDFDVSQIDAASVRLNGKRAVRWSLEDVAGSSAVSPGCDERARPDGVLDLVLKFETADIRKTLIGSAAGQTIEMVVTGELKDQFGAWPFRGMDRLQLRPRQ
jgi:hypothetical protein